MKTSYTIPISHTFRKPPKLLSILGPVEDEYHMAGLLPVQSSSLMPISTALFSFANPPHKMHVSAQVKVPMHQRPRYLSHRPHIHESSAQTSPHPDCSGHVIKIRRLAEEVKWALDPDLGLRIKSPLGIDTLSPAQELWMAITFEMTVQHR